MLLLSSSLSYMMAHPESLLTPDCSVFSCNGVGRKRSYREIKERSENFQHSPTNCIIPYPAFLQRHFPQVPMSDAIFVAITLEKQQAGRVNVKSTPQKCLHRSYTGCWQFIIAYPHDAKCSFSWNKLGTCISFVVWTHSCAANARHPFSSVGRYLTRLRHQPLMHLLFWASWNTLEGG